MCQPLIVCVLQSVGYLSNNASGLIHIEIAVRSYVLSQVHAGNKLGNQVMYLPVFAGIKCAYQIRVIHFGLHLDFPLEIGNRIWSRLSNGKNFYCTFASHDVVASLKHLPHTALPDRIRDCIWTKVEFGTTFMKLI